MDKRYQVFVSSTYNDLKDVRQQVILELMGLQFIPVGMEFFPASDETQWELIQRVIRDCDYYVVIIGGRYGSVDESGMSYTEKEYRYARELGIPVLAFIHEDSAKLADEDTNQPYEHRQKLADFREFCKQKMCKPWKHQDGLPATVLSNILHQAQLKEAVGWVRADQVPDEVTSRDVLRMTQQVDKLQKKLEKYEGEPPPGTDRLAQGEDIFTINGVVVIKWTSKNGMKYDKKDAKVRLTWDVIFDVISPHLLVPSNDDDVKNHLKGYILSREYHQLGVSRGSVDRLLLEDHSILSILTQFRQLGMIENVESETDTTASSPLWKLTPYGDRYMSKVKAIPRHGSE